MDTVAVDEQLQRWLRDFAKPTARIIKIDVESAEAEVIAGLLPALDQLHPTAELAIEVTPRLLATLGHSPADVITPLREAGSHSAGPSGNPSRSSCLRVLMIDRPAMTIA